MSSPSHSKPTLSIVITIDNERLISPQFSIANTFEAIYHMYREASHGLVGTTASQIKYWGGGETTAEIDLQKYMRGYTNGGMQGRLELYGKTDLPVQIITIFSKGNEIVSVDDIFTINTSKELASETPIRMITPSKLFIFTYKITTSELFVFDYERTKPVDAYVESILFKYADMERLMGEFKLQDIVELKDSISWMQKEVAKNEAKLALLLGQDTTSKKRKSDKDEKGDE